MPLVDEVVLRVSPNCTTGAATRVAAMTAQDTALRTGSILQKTNNKRKTEKLLGNHLGRGAIIVLLL